MGDVSSERARLFPVSGIGGADEQERRATSALLAVVGSVREFGRALTIPHGALRVPATVAPIKIAADLRAGLVRRDRDRDRAPGGQACDPGELAGAPTEERPGPAVY
jgi:hypothetical protein